MAKKPIAYMLCRVSTPEQSLESQEETLLSIAKNYGFQVPPECIFREQKTGYDEDINEDRTSIVELRDAIALNKPDAIFCLELSRLSRRAIKLHKYIYEFSVTPNIPMYFADMDKWTIDIETREPNDENILKLIGACESVEKERERIKARTMRGRASAGAKGLYTGHLADGYIVKTNSKNEKYIDTDDERVEVIRRIFLLYQKHSTNEVRDILNAENIPTTNKYRATSHAFNYKAKHKNKSGDIIDRSDDLWTGNSIRQILKNRWYIGERSFMGKEHSVPRIISNELWQEVQDKLNSYPRIIKKGKNLFLLKDLMYCSCGRKMYGHFQGLNNHYYCSSAHTGKKCNTRGICKENAENIVYQIIYNRLIFDVFTNEESPIHRLLQMDAKSLKEEKDKIEAYKNIIQQQKEKIEELEKEYKRACLQIIKSKTEIEEQTYEELKSDIEGQIKDSEKKITEYKNEINYAYRNIETKNSAKHIAEKIADCSLEEFRELLLATVKKFTIFNASKTTSILRIEYANGEVEEIIYSPQKYKDKYFLLTKRVYGPNYELVKANPQTAAWAYVINLNYMQELRYNEVTQKLSFEGRGLYYYDSSIAFILDFESYNTAQSLLQEKGLNVSFNVYENEVEVDTFLSFFMNEKGHRYEKTIIKTERAEEIREYQKIYRKKYNSGKLSSEVYIEKDELYEEINRKRKTLYNKIYKIKNNSKLSDSEKKAKIAEIKKALKELRLKINYKKTSERGAKLLKRLRGI